MGIIKDAADTFIKYSEIFVNKTEEYTRIAKLHIDIKRIQWEIEKIEKELGRIIINKIENSATNIELNDSAIHELFNKYKKFKDEIESKKIEIEDIKKFKNGDENL